MTPPTWMNHEQAQAWDRAVREPSRKAAQQTCDICGESMHGRSRWILMLADDVEDRLEEISACSVTCLHKGPPLVHERLHDRIEAEDMAAFAHG